MAKIIYSLLLCLVLFLSSVFGQEINDKKERYDREPTVSRHESKILADAVNLADKNLKEAITFLREHIDDDSSAALDFALASFYFQDEALEEAEAAYRQALLKFPAFDRARANLARILIKQDKIDEALRELKEILLSGTARPSTLTIIGYTSLLKDEPVPAEMAYRQALLIDPEDQNAYVGLVKSLLMQERFREATTLLEDLLEDNPFSSEFWFLLANARLALDQPKRAIVTLECARRLKLASNEALNTLADLYLNAGRAQEALERYQEAFALNEPSIDRILRAVKAYVMLGDPGRATILLEQIKSAIKKDETKLNPEQSYELNSMEAQCSYLEGDLELAGLKFQELLKKNPLDGEILLALGDISRDKKNSEEAIIFYEQAARISTNRMDALIRQAQLEVELEHYEKSIELLEKAQAIKFQPHVARYLEQVRHLIR